MEVSEMDIKTLRRIEKRSKSSRLQNFSPFAEISSESKKRSRWVEMIKQMPDIRTEKIQSVNSRPPLNSTLALKILNEEC